MSKLTICANCRFWIGHHRTKDLRCPKKAPKPGLITSNKLNYGRTSYRSKNAPLRTPKKKKLSFESTRRESSVKGFIGYKTKPNKDEIKKK